MYYINQMKYLEGTVTISYYSAAKFANFHLKNLRKNFAKER